LNSFLQFYAQNKKRQKQRLFNYFKNQYANLQAFCTGYIFLTTCGPGQENIFNLEMQPSGLTALKNAKQSAY
jgi:hypothetical protein